jgi:hypothetical protein
MFGDAHECGFYGNDGYDVVDHVPDPLHDEEAYCGWPGDGSGEDDLADLMAHGDEGCYDEPNDFDDYNPSETDYYCNED